MELTAQKYLNNDRLLHIDMIEAIRLNEADILYAGEDGVLIYQIPGGIYMLSAANEESAKRISALIKTAQLIVLHQPYLKDELMARFALTKTMVCHQAAYFSNAPIKTPEEQADIRPLQTDDFPVVMEHYSSLPDPEYIKSRISAGMLGIYVDNQLAGFIGTHPEGTIGMLEILPEYRRRGLAFLLESAMMARQQSKSRLPFAQIVEGNEASIALHRKLGMEITRDAHIWWLY